MFKSTALAAAFAALALPAAAQDYHAAMTDYLSASVATWASSDVLVAAIKAANAERAAFTQADIDAMDQAWRAEADGGAGPTIDPVMHNAAADFLRTQVAASGGLISEVFVMDSHGLNVAASAVTSDMWQGDEDKHAKTYAAGAGATFVDEVEFDESSDTYQGQVSMTISDPATGEPIGAITVGLDAEAL
ncbi:MAG: hypothetical protein JXQ91_06420 [Vannielia sp.]|uniref:hypothetical protein n=1 Tax=Rhodobacterales TaxID=204455 RepID=UPI002095B3A4|nr:hypothetical protein [Oceanicola sp. 502str15]MCO6384104.1 hypothetical protein [Oceanicola sp. 502str15]